MARGGLGDLVVRLGADVAGFRADLNRASSIAQKELGSIERSARGIEGSFRNLGRGLVSGLSVAAFASFVKSAIDAADQLGTVSQRLGIAVGDLSALKFAAEQSDTSFETLTTGLQKFEIKMAKAGISSAQTVPVLKDLADRIQATGDTGQRAAILVDAFGKASGPELNAFMAQGSAGIEEQIQKLDDMGGRATPEAVAAAKEFNDQLQAMSSWASAVAANIAGPLLTAINDFAEANRRAWQLSEVKDANEEFRESAKGITDEITQIDEALAGGAPAKEGIIARRAELEGLKTELIKTRKEALGIGGVSAPAAAGGITPAAKKFVAGLGEDPKKKTGTGKGKKDEFAAAMEGLQREIAMVGELTNAEKVLYETQQGRFKAFTDAQKQALVGRAQELDVATAASKAAEAMEGFQQEIAMVGKLTNAEKILYETQQGRYKSLTDAQKQALAGAAQELDAATAANKAAEQVQEGIKSLREERLDAGIAILQDDQAQADAQLKIEADKWQEIIKLVAEGTAERRAIEEEFTAWLPARRAELALSFKDENEQMVETIREAARDMQDAMSNFFFDILQGKAQDFGETFKRFVDKMVADWLASQIQMAIFGEGFAGGGKGGGIGGILGSILGLFGGGAAAGGDAADLAALGMDAAGNFALAKGGAFAGGGNVIPFARGGVVGSPTLFPMAKGMGLMGEAGPEAVLPLKRLAGGNLGVMAQLSDRTKPSTGDVIVNFNLPGVRDDSEFKRSVGQSARNAAQLLERASRRNG